MPAPTTAKRHLAKKILRPSHIGWILNGPKAGGSAMEIDSKSEGFLGTTPVCLSYV
jgi:hypothetical protein